MNSVQYFLISICLFFSVGGAYAQPIGKESGFTGQDKSAEQSQSAELTRPLTPVQPPSNPQFQPVPDKIIPYKKTDKGPLDLHLFFPENHEMSGKTPAAIFFFGGGWVRGHPSQFFYQCDYLSSRGMVAISANYRTRKSHGTTPFDAVEDAKSAVRWLRRHAAELGVDPDKIVAGGGSAGGHLAATTGVIEGFDHPDEDRTISSIPNAMILFNPVLDTTKNGYGFEKVSPRTTDVSPNHHIRPGAPPTLLLHGTNDKTVPYDNALTFVREMKKAGNKVVLFSVEGAGHGFFNPPIIRKTADRKHFPMTMYQVDLFLQELGYLSGEENVRPRGF